MKARYASETEVPVEKSRMELEKLITRFGASQILTFQEDKQAIVQFTSRDRMIRLTLPLPLLEDPIIQRTAQNYQRSKAAARDALAKENRRRWRAMVLLVKAKLTAVEEGIVEFEEEFFANTIMADGQTLYQRARGQVELEYKTGTPRKLLPDLT